MAEEKVPYRFNVYGVEFDVVFSHTRVPLDYKDPILYSDIELAFARKVGTVKTLATKAIRNPNDPNDGMIGQRVAFKRLLGVIWELWYWDNGAWTWTKSRKEFINKGREIAHLAGMWNTDEE